MTLDISLIRKQYPAFSDGTAFLDGAGGTQLPDSVIDAVSDAYRKGLGNAHGEFPASRRADRLVAEARRAVADVARLLGGVEELAP
ncbi:aminotransferase class V-fold PLP-dependent enzyme [Arthrobacter sp. efr-133-R2A-120]|uniref:aminotransferase class V-fold PLP-dependent enzyme n=1 Tax=Arthrobacter sp. efr-133-R2A-120 TaxID=3040277 RepID=UPI00254CC068|nr:aminotransferase class V-fold PLP-dependent enzyme [Arthrobacter sp. efr-133-R2A-120]